MPRKNNFKLFEFKFKQKFCFHKNPLFNHSTTNSPLLILLIRALAGWLSTVHPID